MDIVWCMVGTFDGKPQEFDHHVSHGFGGARIFKVYFWIFNPSCFTVCCFTSKYDTRFKY